jgi:hypothetical protein
LAGFQGIEVSIHDGKLVLTRTGGFTTGHVQFSVDRVQPGYTQHVTSGVVAVGPEASTFDLPFHTGGDSYEVSLTVDMQDTTVLRL